MASVAKRPNGKWRARYRDTAGHEHAKHFPTKREAQRWLDEVTTSIVTGQYVDPNAGRMTFKTYAERWRGMQSHRPATRAHVESMLGRHVYPVLGERPLTTILPSDVQSLVRALSVGSVDRKGLQPATVGVVHSIVSSVMKAAVRDRRIPSNPCVGTRLPKPAPKRMTLLTVEQVLALEEQMPDELAALVNLGSGTGMRPGELFGLTVDRLDMLRREVVVDRQLLTLSGARTEFGPPKTQASNRVIPLPQSVVDVVAAHLATYPTTGLLFTVDGKPITRQAFGRVWRPAVERAGLSVGTRLHDLRHHYASLLIEAGESPKTVQERLGHATAAETLDTYTHLWPKADEKTRDAVDRARGRLADPLRTAQAL